MTGPRFGCATTGFAEHRLGDPEFFGSALDVLPVGDARLPLVLDALRTDDLAPVAAALATARVEGLDAHAYRPAVLKCVAAGVPPAEMGAPRIDDELRRTPRAFAADRVAAGRPVPADVPMVLAGEA
ncbi:EboA domain-containing protein [Umezawaea sp.]|uniref:EboA domain-containing protein n=1 Tax=Umezawaea sp. TaxID=1955258 RepID=UPI002ED20489